MKQCQLVVLIVGHVTVLELFYESAYSRSRKFSVYQTRCYDIYFLLAFRFEGQSWKDKSISLREEGSVFLYI